VDGKPNYSAVFNSPARQIHLERGVPDRPYLADVDGIIEHVQYLDMDKSLHIKMSGIAAQESRVTIVTPFITGAIEINNEKITGSPGIRQDGKVYLITIYPILHKSSTDIVFHFQD